MHLVDDGLLHVPLYGLQHRALRGGEKINIHKHISTNDLVLCYVMWEKSGKYTYINTYLGGVEKIHQHKRTYLGGGGKIHIYKHTSTNYLVLR